MEDMIERLTELADRKDRFTFDLRGNCQVYTGIVCAYRTREDEATPLELAMVVAHAFEHDGIVGAWKDVHGRTIYDSCRLFTDHERALRFARAQGQRAVFNLNRHMDIPVDAEVA